MEGSPKHTLHLRPSAHACATRVQVPAIDKAQESCFRSPVSYFVLRVQVDWVPLFPIRSGHKGLPYKVLVMMGEVEVEVVLQTLYVGAMNNHTYTLIAHDMKDTVNKHNNKK